MRRSGMRALSWLGLALMAASFILLLRQPGFVLRQETTAASAPRHDIFSTVVIDAGHGGQDPGATSATLVEKDVTLDLAHRLEHLLHEKNIRTELTRAGDVYVSLADRAAITNRAQGAIFVSIHCNEGSRSGASGVETYFAGRQPSVRPSLASWLPFLAKVAREEPNEKSQSLAGFIQEKCVSRLQATNRGTKSEQFYVLENVRSPAALVETGFLTNKEDAVHLNDPAYRERLAAAIADGILSYRGALHGADRDE